MNHILLDGSLDTTTESFNSEDGEGTTIPKLTINIGGEKKPTEGEEEENVSTEKYPDSNEGKKGGNDDVDETESSGWLDYDEKRLNREERIELADLRKMKKIREHEFEKIMLRLKEAHKEIYRVYANEYWQTTTEDPSSSSPATQTELTTNVENNEYIQYNENQHKGEKGKKKREKDKRRKGVIAG